MYYCLFDIDGTLIASGGAGKAALESAMSQLHGIERILPKLQLSGRTDRAILRDLLTMHEIKATEEAVVELREAYLSHLPEALAKSDGTVLPGIRSLLADLHRRSDVTLGLLTGNVRAGAKIKLSHYDLFDYFTLGGFGDRHTDRDEVAREAWAEVLMSGGQDVPLDRVWVIGDTPLDIRCAKAIGARVLAVATGWHSEEELRGHQPDLLLSNLSDPGLWLRTWDR